VKNLHIENQANKKQLETEIKKMRK